ncbi:MAG: hypothetical protein PUB98_08480 [Clostridiales bacterium]|nr:hypothetical protein [Clostridiales bacterium]
MSFGERAKARRRRKEQKRALKSIKGMLLAAGCTRKQVREDVRELKEMLQLGNALWMDYEEARAHLWNAIATITRLLEHMGASPAQEVRASLDTLVAELEKIYHECSIRADDADFQCTMQSLKKMVGQYTQNVKDAKTEAGSALALIMLRSELENIKAVLDDAGEWEQPDFLALAYFFLHGEKEELKDMENMQRNAYVMSFFAEGFLQAFMGRCEEAGIAEAMQTLVQNCIYDKP